MNPITESAPVTHQKAQKEPSKASLWTVNQVAEHLQVTRHTVYCWLSGNLLPFPYYKFQRAVRFKREDVLKWIESRKVNPVSSF